MVSSRLSVGRTLLLIAALALLCAAAVPSSPPQLAHEQQAGHGNVLLLRTDNAVAVIEVAQPQGDIQQKVATEGVDADSEEGDFLGVVSTYRRRYLSAAGTDWDFEQHVRKLVRAAIATSVIALLFLGALFGAPVTEVQCVVVMFLSACATPSMRDAMNVSRYFISPVQGMGPVEAIAFNIAFMLGIPLLWFAAVVAVSLVKKTTITDAARRLLFPGGPLIFARLFLPALWFNCFVEMDDNHAAMWCGIVACLLVFIANVFMMAYAGDLYYSDETYYDFLLPNSTSDVARSYFHVLGPGACRLVAVWWTVLPIAVGGIVSPKSVDYGARCDTPWGFLVAIWWIWAFLWVLFRPHGTLVRNVLYVMLYLVCGIITLTIAVGDATAQAVFSFFLLGVVILLIAHSALLWVYTFWIRKGSNKTIDTRNFPQVVLAQTQRFFATVFFCFACCQFEGTEAEKGVRPGDAAAAAERAEADKALPKSLDQELEEERRRDEERYHAENAEIERSMGINGGSAPYGTASAEGSPSKKGKKGGDEDKLKASKLYGVDGRDNDGSAFDMRREAEDERLAREYQAMLNASARAEGDAATTDNAPDAAAAKSPSKQSAAATPQKAVPAPLSASPMGNGGAQSGVFSATSPAATSPARSPSKAVDRDADLQHLPPREKRRIQQERDAAEY